MRALVDEQLPIALARWIAAHGHPAEHVSEVGLSGRPDHEVVRYAVSTGAVIITKDEDFAAFALRQNTIQVAWLRVGNVSNPVLLARMDLLWPQLLARLARGEGFVEVR